MSRASEINEIVHHETRGLDKKLQIFFVQYRLYNDERLSSAAMLLSIVRGANEGRADDEPLAMSDGYDRVVECVSDLANEYGLNPEAVHQVLEWHAKEIAFEASVRGNEPPELA